MLYHTIDLLEWVMDGDWIGWCARSWEEKVVLGRILDYWVVDFLWGSDLEGIGLRKL